MYKFLFLLLISQLIWAQAGKPVFEHYSLKEGLSQSNARCILQDRTGFVWIGTQDGLNRFDGYEFTVFKHDPENVNSISNNLISCMIEDREGYIWLGTMDGLDKYDPVYNKFIHFKADIKNPKALQAQSVISLCEDKDGNIWAGTYMGGLSCFSRKDNSFTTYHYIPGSKNSLSNNNVLSICEDANGNLWLGTYGGGLNKFDRKKTVFTVFRRGKSRNSLSSDFVNSIQIKGNKLFMATGNGLNVLDLNRNEIEVYLSQSAKTGVGGNNKLSSLLIDKIGMIWTGSEDGLNLFNPYSKKFTRFQNNPRDPESLSEDHITSLLEDITGLIWIGTNSAGINKFNRTSRNFLVYRNDPALKNTISDNVIWPIIEDSKGNIWIGTNSGLNKIVRNSSKLEKYFHNPSNTNSLSDNRIWALCEDRKGFVWIGTQNGLNKLDPLTNKIKRYVNKPGDKNSLPVNVIKSIYEDRYGYIWLGTFGFGVIKFDSKNNSFKAYQHDAENDKSISDNIVFSMIEDSKGNFWLCTTQGLNCFDRQNETFKSYFHNPERGKPFPANTFYYMTEDPSGSYWIASHGGGLIRFEPEKNNFHTFNEKSGLANNVVYGILKDNNNCLWLSTNNGLSRFNIREEKFKNYDVSDGLPSNEFNAQAFCRSRSGRFYFGSINGLVSFHPDSIAENHMFPKVAISRFRIFDKYVNPYEVLRSGKEMEIHYYQNYFSFEFSALDFTVPLKNQYAYMLEGYDKEWIYSGKRRYAAYTNLPPGSYRFHVIASNNDGLWNMKGTSIEITIIPPFWAAWWFRLLILLGAASVVIYFYRRRIMLLKKEKLAQELFSKQLIDSQENERRRIANELHDSIGQNLLIINNRAVMAMKSGDINNTVKELNQISQAAIESITEVREISHNLHPFHMEELGVTKSIQIMIDKVKQTSLINFSVYLENVDDLVSMNAGINIFRILQEGLNNIVKHSMAKNVVVSLSTDEKFINLLIRDDGKGIDVEKVNMSIGIGLKGMSERVKFFKGNFSIESASDNGTAIKIKIPIERANNEF